MSFSYWQMIARAASVAIAAFRPREHIRNTFGVLEEAKEFTRYIVYGN